MLLILTSTSCCANMVVFVPLDIVVPVFLEKIMKFMVITHELNATDYDRVSGFFLWRIFFQFSLQKQKYK